MLKRIAESSGQYAGWHGDQPNTGNRSNTGEKAADSADRSDVSIANRCQCGDAPPQGSRDAAKRFRLLGSFKHIEESAGDQEQHQCDHAAQHQLITALGDGFPQKGPGFCEAPKLRHPENSQQSGQAQIESGAVEYSQQEGQLRNEVNDRPDTENVLEPAIFARESGIHRSHVDPQGVFDQENAKQ